MSGNEKALEFGHGKLVIDGGTYGGKPAVFIAPAKQPGEVNTSAARENRPLDRLTEDEMVLTFPTEEQANYVLDALFNRPRGSALTPSAIASAGGGEVVVKPLEWGEPCGYEARAETEIGVYAIDGFPGQVPPYRLSNPPWGHSSHATLDAAKAAAQADYEARIRSALATPPAPAVPDLADWSALPKDLYVTSVRTSDGIVFDATLCSVPMAIGLEVRYSLAPAATGAGLVGALRELIDHVHDFGTFAIDGDDPLSNWEDTVVPALVAARAALAAPAEERRVARDAIAKAVADEREACAKLADEMAFGNRAERAGVRPTSVGSTGEVCLSIGGESSAKAIAVAIRARTTKEAGNG